MKNNKEENISFLVPDFHSNSHLESGSALEMQIPDQDPTAIIRKKEIITKSRVIILSRRITNHKKYVGECEKYITKKKISDFWFQVFIQITTSNPDLH